MFSDYTAAVTSTYKRKKEKGDLALNLLNPTTAKLKDEWLNVINEEYKTGHDEALLRDYFGPKDDLVAYERAIKTNGADKCKPLNNFLNGDIAEPKERTIELLAWLIKFEPRPYSRWNHIKENIDPRIEENDGEKEIVPTTQMPPLQERADEVGSENNLVNENTQKNTPQHEEVTIPPEKVIEKDKHERNRWKKRPKLKYLIAFVAIIGLGLSFVFFTGGRYLNNPFKNQCMYWSADHYEQIDCDANNTNVQVIGLDQQKLFHFQKIIRPDTLKKDCIGHIWYSKIDTEVEFFTESGMHPIHREKGLKVVTHYIYNTYIAKDSSTVK